MPRPAWTDWVTDLRSHVVLMAPGTGFSRSAPEEVNAALLEFLSAEVR